MTHGVLGRLAAPSGAIALYALTLGVLATAVVWQTGGTLAYIIDDPYIHLALARRMAEGTYGVNPGEPSAPSSSMIWPVLLVPLRGIGVAGPFLLNALAGAWTVGTLAAGARWLDRGADAVASPALRLLLVGLGALALNLFALPFFGMEHTLQVALTLAGVAGLMREAETGRMPRVAWVALALGPWVRYENLAVTLPALAWLAWRGHWRGAFAAAAVALGGLAAFSAFLAGLGLAPIPASITSKSTVVASGLSALLGHVRTATTDTRGALLLTGGLALAASAVLGRRPVPERGVAAVAAAVVALHSLAGEYNFRYEVYVVAAVVPVLVWLHQEAVARVWKARPVGMAVLATLGVGLLFMPYLGLAVLTPLNARVVYEQQGQMARFVAEAWQRPVAVNDLGYVAYRSPTYVLDLVGLASPEAARLQRLDPSGTWIGRLSDAHGVDAALVYASWFPGRPATWERVGSLRVGARPRVMTIARDSVDVFATRPEARAALVDALQRFRPSLPPGVTLWIAGDSAGPIPADG